MAFGDYLGGGSGIRATVNATATTATLSVSPGAGDLMVCWVRTHDTGSPVTLVDSVDTNGSDWTLDDVDSYGTITFRRYSKIAAGGETTVTFDPTVGVTQTIMVALFDGPFASTYEQSTLENGAAGGIDVTSASVTAATNTSVAASLSSLVAR